MKEDILQLVFFTLFFTIILLINPYYAAFYALVLVFIKFYENNLKKGYFISKYTKQNRNENELECQIKHFIEILLHDLKTPTLAQLRGLELLNNNFFGVMNQEQKDMILEIQKTCEYTLGMINMVLNVYRLETGQNKLLNEKFNILDLIKECLNSITNDKNDILFELKANFDGFITADKKEIKKVLQRLIETALVYSDKESPILFELNRNKFQIKVSITTNGILIPANVSKKMFNKFSDEYSRFSTIGENIGLYMSKKIIDLHKGKIFVSTDGKTSNTFTFVIPINLPKNKEQRGKMEVLTKLSY